jgi:hypothetical protein
MDVLNDEVVKYERPAARASEDGFDRPSVAIYIFMQTLLGLDGPRVNCQYSEGQCIQRARLKPRRQ